MLESFLTFAIQVTEAEDDASFDTKLLNMARQSYPHSVDILRNLLVVRYAAREYLVQLITWAKFVSNEATELSTPSWNDVQDSFKRFTNKVTELKQVMQNKASGRMIDAYTFMSNKTSEIYQQNGISIHIKNLYIKLSEMIPSSKRDDKRRRESSDDFHGYQRE